MNTILIKLISCLPRTNCGWGFYFPTSTLNEWWMFVFYWQTTSNKFHEVIYLQTFYNNSTNLTNVSFVKKQHQRFNHRIVKHFWYHPKCGKLVWWLYVFIMYTLLKVEEATILIHFFIQLVFVELRFLPVHISEIQKTCLYILRWIYFRYRKRTHHLPIDRKVCRHTSKNRVDKCCIFANDTFWSACLLNVIRQAIWNYKYHVNYKLCAT